MRNNRYFVLLSSLGKPTLTVTLATVLVLFISQLGSLPSTALDEPLTHSLSVTGIDGSNHNNVRKTFNAMSLLREKTSTEMVSVANLRAKIKSDADLLRRILRSEGYYASVVTTGLARNLNHFQIEIRVDAGPLYGFGDVQFDYIGLPPDAVIIEQIKQRLSLKPGQPAIAESFVAAEARVNSALFELGFPFAKRLQHDLVVDHESRSLNVTFIFETGIRRRMGVVHYNGLKTVNNKYLDRFTEWDDDAFFARRLVTGLRTRLMQSRLFSSVRIEPEPMGSDRVDLQVTVFEADHRTISLTAGYSTAEGVGGEVSWEHRDMFERGGLLRITARGAEIEQSLTGRIELPHFSRLDQTLSIENLFRRQNTDAFLSYEAETRLSIDRILTPQLAVFAGVGLEYSDVTDTEGDRDFLLASLPIGVRWDTSDDLLNPTRGFRASLVTAPSTNFGSNGFTFLKSELRASTYFQLVRKKRLIAALRTRFGSILGTTNETLPATQRFFAGGGGSVRGFSFQNVGLLGPDNNPFGGRSVAEATGELRFKVSDSVGFVSFIDGGNTYADAFPTLANFRWGAGLGARYYTSFGPIRFDIAFPLNRRPGENRFQFYVSLGQAF